MLEAPLNPVVVPGWLKVFYTILDFHRYFVPIVAMGLAALAIFSYVRGHVTLGLIFFILPFGIGYVAFGLLNWQFSHLTQAFNSQVPVETRVQVINHAGWLIILSVVCLIGYLVAGDIYWWFIKDYIF